MLLPIFNLLVDASAFALMALRTRLSDPASTYADRLQLLLISLSLVSGALIVWYLSQATTPAAAQQICGLVTACASPTP